MEKFKNANQQELDLFHKTAHGSYAHFGKITNGAFELYSQSAFFDLPDYGANSSFNLESGKFTTHQEDLWDGTSTEAAALWNGKIISGRYAQNGDSLGIIETTNSSSPHICKKNQISNSGALYPIIRK